MTNDSLSDSARLLSLCAILRWFDHDLLRDLAESGDDEIEMLLASDLVVAEPTSAGAYRILPDASLRREIEVREPTRGRGSPRRWHPITPAMVAGLTDHVRTTTELLSYRVPVTFLDTLHKIEHLFPLFDSIHQDS
jgi:hypothetical protein